MWPFPKFSNFRGLDLLNSYTNSFLSNLQNDKYNLLQLNFKSSEQNHITKKDDKENTDFLVNIDSTNLKTIHTKSCHGRTNFIYKCDMNFRKQDYYYKKFDKKLGQNVSRSNK